MTPTLIDLLWQTSWQAGLMAGVVWLACRCWPRLPATLRTSLWWLVCLKFVVGLAGPQPIALAVLPQTTPSDAAITQAEPATPAVVDVTVASSSASGATTAEAASAATSPATRTRVSGAQEAARPGANFRSANASPANGRSAFLRAWPTGVALLWLLGVVVQGARLTRQFKRTRAVVARGRPVDDETAALFEELAARVGVSTMPRLLASDEIVSPLVTGVRRPTVLVPAAMLADDDAGADDAGRWSRRELAMTLCHELLHIRRRDLWHGWIPSAASYLFFFHPLALLAAREYALAREAACDARVLHLLQTPAEDYGRLIVRLGVRPRDAAPAAAGASASFRTLQRRLIMLHDASLHARAISPRWWIVGAIAAVTVLPIRLVAQPAPQPAPPASEPQPTTRVESSARTYSVSVPTAVRTTTAGTVTIAARDGGDGSFAATVTTPDGEHAPLRMTVVNAGDGTQGQPRSRRTETTAARDADNKEWGEPWVLLSGDQQSMNGSWSHVQEARRLQSSSSDRLLWFLRDGRPYVIRDAQTLDAIEALWKPQSDLGRQQGELGERQGRLGAEQSNLGARQGDLGAQQGALGARMNDANADLLAAIAAEMRGSDARSRAQRAEAEARLRDLSNKMSDLGRQQASLGQEQAALGEKQATLGREQGALGQQQAALARKAVKEMRAVMDKAIAAGLATRVP